jgi:hypothetical protein
MFQYSKVNIMFKYMCEHNINTVNTEVQEDSNTEQTA